MCDEKFYSTIGQKIIVPVESEDCEKNGRKFRQTGYEEVDVDASGQADSVVSQSEINQEINKPETESRYEMKYVITIYKLG